MPRPFSSIVLPACVSRFVERARGQKVMPWLCMLAWLNIAAPSLQAAAEAPAPVPSGPQSDGPFRKVILDADHDIDRDGRVDDTLVDVMELAVAGDGRVVFIERAGVVKVWKPDTRTSIVLGRLAVYHELEDGLLGVTLDPGFLRNGWLYLFYSEPETHQDANGKKVGTNRVSRFSLKGDVLDLSSEKVLLRIATQREQCCHSAGSLAFDTRGNLFASVGDNTHPGESDGYSPLDERSDRGPWNSQKSASNANDLRGKILRIHPEPDGTVTIPAGNLFPAGTANTRPEIYTMGNRNPFRISVDPHNGFLYWGEVGPDSGGPNPKRGPAGFDEINQARAPGNFGWPYFAGDNKPYNHYDFATRVSGDPFDPARPINNSVHNTGPRELPPAQPAFIWYPYGPSTRFPVVNGGGGRTAMAGPVYHFDSNLASPHKLPVEFDHTLFIYEWSRNWIIAVHLDAEDHIARKPDGSLWMERFCPNMTFKRPMDLELGPDGCLYLLENGTGWSGNKDTQIVRIEYHPGAAADATLFARTNLMAWCIVPFDAKKRGPEERAAMLERLGFKHFAYDYRAEHVPTFDAEIEALQRHGVQLDAWWFPTELNAEGRVILDVLRRHQLHAQLWVMGGGGPTRSPAEQRARVEAEAARIKPIAIAAAAIGCTVALYNHGAWFGEPENQLEILERLGQDGLRNIGIVYNLHHGHEHLDRFPALLQKMKPHLAALNLNGMVRDGERLGKKILPLGQGDLDLQLLRIIRDSGWRGPIGILNHTDEDAEARLKDNLDGLDWLVPQLDGAAPGPKPKPRSWREPAPPPPAPPPSSSSPSSSAPVEDAAARAALPEFRIIPAAPVSELTPGTGFPDPSSMTNWHRSLGDAASSRYSALAQINRGNVQRLEVAWTYHSGDGVGNIQCNPIVVDGVFYGPTVGHRLVALDAATGWELWRYRPEMPERGLRLEDPPARRGLLYWPGDSTAPGRLLFTAGDWIYALDPGTGRLVEGFGEHGRASLPTGGTVAGAVYQRALVVPGFNRDVFGYDVATGRRLWTFHTLPRPGEFGHETWSRVEEGANCWGGMALDEQRGIAYIATGSPKPNFVGTGHHGENLFANCVLALDATTGRRLWHFQEIRHDIWDLDLPAAPNLVTIMHEGRRVDAVAQVTKIGNTLLLDRLTGRPLFPFRLRRAPTSTLPGEWTAPYQPAPELPEPFARQEFTPDEVTGRSEEAREYVSKRVAGANHGWFTPFAEGKPTVLYGIHGGAEWTGAAFDPTSGCLYVSANELPWIITVFRDDPEPPGRAGTPTAGEQVYQENCASCHGPDRVGVGMAPPLRGVRHRLKDADVLALMQTGRNLMPPAPPLTDAQRRDLMDFLFLRDRAGFPAEALPREPPRYTHNGYPKLLDQDNYPGCKPPWGTLNCIDLNTGRLRWKVPLGEYPELTAQGLPRTGTENFGGPMVTAGGLVFCAGTRDGMIRAFNKQTGAERWRHKLPFGGFAPPATYAVKGRQFVVIAATGGGKLGTKMGDAYVAFALPDAGGAGTAPGPNRN